MAKRHLRVLPTLPADLPANLVPVAKWHVDDGGTHQWPTRRGLETLVYRNPDGLADCVHRVNGRVLIDEEAFARWVGARAEERVRKG